MKRAAMILLLAASLLAMAQTGPHRGLFTPAAASFVQGIQCFHNFNGSPDCAQSFLSNVTAGHLLIAICTDYTNNPIGTMSAFDSQGNSYTQRIATGLNTAASTNSESWLFTATAGSSAADTVTCRTSAGAEGNYRGSILEYASPLTFDVGAGGNNNTGTTGVTNNITTTATDVVFTYGYANNSGGGMSVATPAGYTQDYIDPNFNVSIFRKNNVPAGAQSVKVVSLSGAGMIHAGLYGIKP